MPKSNAVPINDGDSESGVSMTGAKSSRTIALTVILDPKKASDRTMSVSDERLLIDNGDEVRWEVRFVDSKRNPVIAPGILEVRFSASGSLASKRMQSVGGGRRVVGIIKGSLGKRVQESYSVFFEGGQLKFVSSSNPPLSSPCLVIQPVGDPPGGPGPGPMHDHPGHGGDGSDGDRSMGDPMHNHPGRGDDGSDGDR